MAILKTEEYNISYFDSLKAREQGKPKHPAGYSRYEVNTVFNKTLRKQLAKLEPSQYKEKKVLDLGCAKGFVVQKLRGLGIDAYGIDVSKYAIDNAPEAVKPFLTIGDVRTSLSSYSDNEFGLIFSALLLECIPEVDLPSLVSEINRVSEKQIHLIDETKSPDYYTKNSLSSWKEKGFNKNTLLVDYHNGEEVLV